MPGFLVVNPRSGHGRTTPDELSAAARARGITVHVLAEGDDLAAIVSGAEADAIGIAGGDGSLGVVAGVAVERGIPFVCVPFGTRNHFARDLGLVRDDPIGALGAFDAGLERRVDLARIGERVFLNNASFGLYAHLVDRRERQRRRGAALARVRALNLSLRERRPIRLTLDGEELAARVVLVSNNAYKLKGLELGERKRLDEGQLHLYLVNTLLPRAWRELPSRSVASIGGHDALAIALDGEPATLEAPFELTISPGALRMLVPSRA